MISVMLVCLDIKVFLKLFFLTLSFQGMTVYVDKRMSFGAYKNCLVPYVGVSSECFRVSGVKIIKWLLVIACLYVSKPTLQTILQPYFTASYEGQCSWKNCYGGVVLPSMW